MRNLILLLPFLLFMTSCGMLSNLSEGISKGREMLGEIKQSYDELKPAIDTAVNTTKDLIADGKRIYEQGTEIASEFKEMSAEAKSKADKDGDGELSLYERLAYLITLGGGAAEIARRKMKSTNNSVAVLHARIDREREKRKANEPTS